MTTTVTQNSKGEYQIQLPPELNCKLGDTLKWTIDGDTVILSKVDNTKYLLFDIEELFMSCWGIIDDLKWHTQDDFYIKGLTEVYEFKFKKLWEKLEQLYR